MNSITKKQPISSSEADIIEAKLVRMIRTGLAEAGIPTGNRRYGLILIDSLKWPIGLAIRPYTREVPVWRITFGGRERRPWSCLIKPRELTFHLSELNTQTGVDLARLLREPDWCWPLFEHDRCFPSYAWSKLAHETYETHRLEREALEKRAMERRALR
jgi:hypothetical protein